MNEEVLRLLKMVEEGKISADKAKELMEAFNSSNITTVSTKMYEDKFFKIKVFSADGDKVNIQLPIKVIKAIIKVSGTLPLATGKLQGFNIDDLVDTVVTCLDSEVMGEIVSVDSAAGDTVRIVIE